MAEWDEDARALLRAAAYRRDGDAGLAVLADRPLGPVLQYAGDVLAVAAAQGLPGAEATARKCVEELDGRGGPGDAELAAELTAALEGTPAPLAEVPVELGELGTALDRDPAEGVQVVDLWRGEVGEPDPGFAPDDAGHAPARWPAFWPAGPPGGDGPADGSVDGAWAREERQRGRARAWLAAHGLRPGPRPFL
ncbi:hypothetical protein ACFY4C_06175 [Actinomadura viridis]|uniref:hypothetical protein n=1 Tax=Actinomadura viridis TaxID=58110 RepID=UPI00367DF1DD